MGLRRRINIVEARTASGSEATSGVITYRAVTFGGDHTRPVRVYGRKRFWICAELSIYWCIEGQRSVSSALSQRFSHSHVMSFLLFFIGADNEPHEIDMVVSCNASLGERRCWRFVRQDLAKRQCSRVVYCTSQTGKAPAVALGSKNAETDSRAKFSLLADERGEHLLQHAHVKPHVAAASNPDAPFWMSVGQDVQQVPEQRAHRKFSGGSGCSPEDLPTTDFGESLDLKQPGARATEQPLTQTGEVQLERQVSNLRQSGHFHCHDDVAIRTVFENYDKRLVPHTQK
ncbi:uncharacterized protein [Dermacentor andersoni]|uniref:uncharacterized protein n=1 Tax=Dermacentor andersoni TaxID=34620 RepID=UPI003B3B7A9B